ENTSVPALPAHPALPATLLLRQQLPLNRKLPHPHPLNVAVRRRQRDFGVPEVAVLQHLLAGLIAARISQLRANRERVGRRSRRQSLRARRGEKTGAPPFFPRADSAA